jgi:SulP family sulfate permease
MHRKMARADYCPSGQWRSDASKGDHAVAFMPQVIGDTSLPSIRCAQGIVVAIILSLAGLAAQVANPVVHVIGRKRGSDILRPLSPDHPDDETIEGLLILRPEGRLFFLNAQQVADQIQAAISRYDPRVVVLDLSGVVDIEYSALQMLAEGHQRLSERGVKLWLAELNPSVLEYLKASKLPDKLGPNTLYHNAEAAARSFEAGIELAPRI